ncbi:MAG: serine hydrolase domain-containing protein [Acidobacteriota bacterium]
MSTERLSRIAPAMQRYIDDGFVAGTVTLVARRGQIVHFEARGYRDVDSKAPMTRDNIFRLASMTKPIASVALMILWEEGRVGLQDPVAKYLPEFEDVEVSTTGDASGNTGSLEPPKSPMTVRQLLSHTAGLANSYIGNRTFFGEYIRKPPPTDTLEKLVQRLAELPLNYHPGTQWQYSLATDVVARLVEVISGMSFDAFLRQRIFEPLDMMDTSHFLDRSKAGRLASRYRAGETGRIVLADPGSTQSPLVSGPKTRFRGATGLLSTADDYLRFQQMMLNGGQLDGVQLLGRKTVELMFANHTGDMPVWVFPTGVGFGLGYAVLLDRGAAATPQTEGTVSWGGAFGTWFWVDRKEELIGLLMYQVSPNNHLSIRNDFITLVSQAIVD